MLFKENKIPKIKHISLLKALMCLCFEKGWSQSTLTSLGRWRQVSKCNIKYVNMKILKGRRARRTIQCLHMLCIPKDFCVPKEDPSCQFLAGVGPCGWWVPRNSYWPWCQTPSSISPPQLFALDLLSPITLRAISLSCCKWSAWAWCQRRF